MSTPTRPVQVGDLWIETTPKGRELLLEVTSTSLHPRFAPSGQRFVELRNTISGRREVIDSAELHASDWLRPVLQMPLSELPAMMTACLLALIFAGAGWPRTSPACR